MEMRMATRGIGKRCRFVEREEAEDALKALLKVQPHAILRIVPT